MPSQAPTQPYLTDNYEAIDQKLWARILLVARGRRQEFSRVGPGGRLITIHAPNEGHGFHRWPSPKAVAWAVKQYNNFGGQWQPKKEASLSEEQGRVLSYLNTGAVLTASAEADSLA